MLSLSWIVLKLKILDSGMWRLKAQGRIPGYKSDSGNVFNKITHVQYVLAKCACYHVHTWGFPGGSVVKNPCINPGDLGLIPRLGRSPGGGHGNPLQYSCLETPLDRGAWWATVHGVTKSRTQLSPRHTHVQISILVLGPQVQPTLAPSDCSSLVSLAQRRVLLLILSLKKYQRPKQQTLVPHTSGGWKFEIMLPWWSEF